MENIKETGKHKEERGRAMRGVSGTNLGETATTGHANIQAKEGRGNRNKRKKKSSSTLLPVPFAIWEQGLCRRKGQKTLGIVHTSVSRVQVY